MWIVLGIIAFIVLVITVILLLPIYITIKIDKENDFSFKIKFLNKVFGEKTDNDNKLVKTLKDALGVSRFKKKKKSNSSDENIVTIIKENFSLIVELIKEIVRLLTFCKAKKFNLNIVCANKCAATAAITYGECCAIVSPILGFIHSIVKIKRSSENINIECKYDSDDSEFTFETVLLVRVFRVIAAFLRVMWSEAKHRNSNSTDDLKNNRKSKIWIVILDEN